MAGSEILWGQRKSCLERVFWLVLAHLSSGLSPPSPDPWQKVLALEGTYSQMLPALCCCCSTHPTAHDTSHSSAGTLRECCCGGQNNKKEMKLLLMLFARKLLKRDIKARRNKERQENLVPGRRQPLHFSHLCKAVQQPKPCLNSLMSLQWHVF